MKKVLIFIFSSVALLYCLLLGTYLFVEKKMLYHPPADKLSDCILPIGSEFFEYGSARGIYQPAQHRKLFIFFHGNADHACAWKFLGNEHLGPRGYDTLIMEYPGYSGTEGTPSLKANLQMVVELTDWIVSKNYEAVVVSGYSLGTGPASKLAASIGADALLLYAPYDEMRNVVHDQAPYIPRWVVQENYDSINWLKGYQGYVKIIHGDMDNLILPRHSENLANSLANVDRLVLNGYGHNGLFIASEFENYLDEILPAD